MPSPITPELIVKLTSVSDPCLSADGSRVAFVRSTIDRVSLKQQSKITVATTNGGDAVDFTSGDENGSPRFSPDGASMAFVRPDGNGRKQIWIIPTAGGEARQLTSVPGGIAAIEWSPDSSSLAFASDVDPDLPPGDAADAKMPRTKVVRRIRYRGDTIGWRGDAFSHIFTVDVSSGEMKQITDGDGDDSAPTWSPDGSGIAFIGDRRDAKDIETRSDVYVVASGGGALEHRSEGLSGIAAVTWSPTGHAIAVVGSDRGEAPAGWQGWLYMLQPGQPPRRLTDDSLKPAGGYAPLIPPPDIRWRSDDRIVFQGDARGESALYEIAVTDGALHKIAGGGAMFTAVTFDAAGKRAVVLSATPDSPGNLHRVELDSGAMSQLTDYNREYLREHPPALFEKFTMNRAVSEIESRLFFPPDFDQTQQYPLVLDIHGGPHGVFSDAFNDIQQVLATAGYIVLAVNPRGTSTYGVDFMMAVHADWGGGDYLDIMAAVDEVSARDYVDASRLGITGYSYGGFMSSWIIGHDTRFDAAVVGAPCINLSSMYGTSDIGVSFGEVQWGGRRVDAVDAFREHSPLTYAQNVETPVLLMHGEADARCPIEQSEQYFVALKRLDKEVEFVRFPDCAHSFLRRGHPKLRMEYLSRMLDWMIGHIGAGTSSHAEAEPVPADD
ncbi:MAG TPA: S9 family peptidase [SAR202 cluster bacterium]|nr:S9 family peptidase [SAR202 cluster bacterium]